KALPKASQSRMTLIERSRRRERGFFEKCRKRACASFRFLGTTRRICWQSRIRQKVGNSSVVLWLTTQRSQAAQHVQDTGEPVTTRSAKVVEAGSLTCLCSGFFTRKRVPMCLITRQLKRKRRGGSR